MIEVAIFPIPDSVTFPGNLFPLHVFEPRYRHMVRHCLEKKILLGVCHTQKVVSEAKPHQSVDEALSSNQATYKPVSIFSAGYCELIKELDDGRLYLHVHMQERFAIEAEIQTLPFTIAHCSAYTDVAVVDTAKLALLQQKILRRLQAMTTQQESICDLLASSEWVDKDPIAFSLAIFNLLPFDSAIKQNMLEMRSAHKRLDYLLNFLNQ